MRTRKEDMHELQELVRLHRMGRKPRDVARLLKMGPNRERRLRQAVAAAGLLEGDPHDLPEPEELRAATRSAPSAPPRQEVSSVSAWGDRIRAAADKGAGPTAIHQMLKQEEPEYTGSVSAVKRFYARLKRDRPVRPEDVAIRVQTAPGQYAQVDFGYAGELFDPRSGKLRKSWVFVMVLAYSRHLFAKIVFDQRTPTFLRLHAEAFAYFGGVVKATIPDNLKAAVIRAAFGVDTDDASLNRSYCELARHYGFQVDPTPPRDPRKKGTVESGVKYVKRNFLKPRDFVDVDDANRRLAAWTTEIAGVRNHGTTGRPPIEVFEEEERTALLPLPKRAYEAIEWKKAKVHPDSHLTFDGRFYSVPFRFIGERAWVRATATAITVYVDDERVAVHKREGCTPWETKDEHLPQERVAYRYRSGDYWLERAQRVGDPVRDLIVEVFNAEGVRSRLRTVQSIVTMLEGYPRDRACAAAARARLFGNHTYVGLKEILKKGLDFEPLQPAMFPPPTATRFARPSYEFRAVEADNVE